MSGLFDSLSSASNALTAHRVGLDVVGQNLANINTPGYTRRILHQAELPPTDPLSAGRGVEITGIVALRDLFVEARLRNELQAGAFDTALVESLSAVEAALGLPGTGLDARLTAFFDAFAALGDDPMSAVARDGVVHRAGELTAGFADVVGRLDTARREADITIQGSVSEVNRLAAEISDLNIRISQSGHDIDALKDRQTVLLGELSQLVGIAVLSREDGGVDVTVAGGHAIVIGENAYALEIVPGPVVNIMLGEADVTTTLAGGRIGGSLQARDAIIPGYLAQLDQIAFDLATAVNGVHLTGFDLDGAAGGSFFVAPAGVAGAAAALAVDAAIVADPSLIAASATGAVGDNQVARALAALRDAPISAGGTMDAFEAWAELTFLVGSDVAATRASESGHALVQRQLESLRAQTSGVSYDEEAAHLMRYQRAYEASARYFTTIVDTIDTLMEMVR